MITWTPQDAARARAQLANTNGGYGWTCRDEESVRALFSRALAELDRRTAIEAQVVEALERLRKEANPLRCECVEGYDCLGCRVLDGLDALLALLKEKP